MTVKLTLLVSVFAAGTAGLALGQTASANPPSGILVVAQQQQPAANNPQQDEKKKKAPPPRGANPRTAPPPQKPAAHPQQKPQKPAQATPPAAKPATPPKLVHPPQSQPPKPPQTPNIQHPVKPAEPPAAKQPPRPEVKQPARPEVKQPAPLVNTPKPSAPAQAKPGEATPQTPAPLVNRPERGPQPPGGNAQNRPGPNGPQRIDQIRSERKETKEGNRTVIRENNRTIIRENNTTIIRHDDTDRFRRGARDVEVQRRGEITRTVFVRPGGVRVIEERDARGRVIRRVRVVNGREYVLFNNRYDRPRNGFGFVVVLPPPVVHIPRDHYIVEVDRAPPTLIYDTLVAPPVEPVAQAYTLDQIRYNQTVRERMPRIDLDTITFETGSWEITPDQAQRLAPIATAMKRAIERNPNEVYLIEGHTDAVGDPEDNLSLSDRRAEAVAEVLTSDFGIPPENMVTQGYGEQYLKVQTSGPSQANRRVTVRRITPLLAGK